MKVAGVMQYLRLVATLVVGLCVGCGALWDASLPEELPLSLVKGETMTAAINTGPPSWADSTWAVYGVESEASHFSHPGESADFEVDGEWVTYSLLARFELGPRGEIIRLTDNAFQPATIGSVLYLDGRLHGAAEPRAQYVCESYGIELGEQVACTAYGKYFAGPLLAGSIEIAVSGQMNDVGNRATGQGSLSIEYADWTGASEERHEYQVVALQEFPRLQAPGVPARLMPADGAEGLSTDSELSELSWADTADTDVYEVYFGTTNPPVYVDEVTAGRYTLPPLAPGTTYYWQVIAINDAGTTNGPLRSFATTLESWPNMVLIPAGAFAMGNTFDDGSADEQPLHTVYVDAFYMNAFEVTDAQYAAALGWAYYQGNLINVNQIGMGSMVSKYDDDMIVYCTTNWNGRAFTVGADRANHPNVTLTWYGAAAYCNWRSTMEGRTPCYDTTTWVCDFGANGYRLPTEAEWEKAARGGAVGHRFPWSDTDTIDQDRANYYASPSYYPYDVSPTSGEGADVACYGDICTSPVGSFAANGYGLYDMAGNAEEWCNDWYAADYYSEYSANNWPANPRGPATGLWRVTRDGRVAASCRTACRGWQIPDAIVSNGYNGFRCVSKAQ